jgi:predicted TIM-barrel fold metal-dependent hydrolase
MAAEDLATWPIYSCDDHLDWNAVPPLLWETYLPNDLRERGPRVVERDGRPVWVVGDQQIGVSGKPAMDRFTKFAAEGVEDDGFRPSTPELRLADMDRDGIHASVIYGPSILGLPIDDQVLKAHVWRAWNDWAAKEFNGYAPERLSILPVIPTDTPASAAAEVERCAGLGHRGALLYVHEIDCGDPIWDRVWAAAADTSLPISFHIGKGTSRLTPVQRSWRTPAFSSVAPVQADEPLAAMVFGGALERNPGFTLVLAECGVGWLPYFVARMDAQFEKWRGFAEDHDLETRPSEIVARQVKATFEEEPLGPQLIPLLGADIFMWASDYPHPDSSWPRSMEAIHHALGTLPVEDRKKVTADTCKALYRF